MQCLFQIAATYPCTSLANIATSNIQVSSSNLFQEQLLQVPKPKTNKSNSTCHAKHKVPKEESATQTDQSAP